MWQQEILETMELDDTLKKQVRKVLERLELERCHRQHEGITGAKERGVQFGRPRMEVRNIKKAYRLYEQNQLSVTEMARLCGVARSTMYRRLNEYKECKRILTAKND